MGLRPHYLLGVLIAGAGVIALAVLWYLAKRMPDRRLRFFTRWGIFFAALVVTAAAATAPLRISTRLPNEPVQWIKGLALLFSAWAIYAVPVLSVLKYTSGRMPERRRLLRNVGYAALSVPFAGAAAAFVGRENLQFREFNIAIPGLPKALDGIRIVQLSDIHLGAFVEERLLARAVSMANECKANIALVTGDLISVARDPLDKCLQVLGGLRSEAGTYGCLGNHEIYVHCEAYTVKEGAKLGMKFLRQQSELFTFGDAKLNMVGVDYQRRGAPYLPGAEKLLRADATNILLSHNPDVFPIAASKGFDLTIAGHTHGGQVNFEILEENVNVARFFTPYIYGRYQRGGKSLFVTRGIGTVGAPARLGAPPEVALIRLCAS